MRAMVMSLSAGRMKKSLLPRFTNKELCPLERYSSSFIVARILLRVATEILEQSPLKYGDKGSRTTSTSRSKRREITATSLCKASVLYPLLKRYVLLFLPRRCPHRPSGRHRNPRAIASKIWRQRLEDNVHKPKQEARDHCYLALQSFSTIPPSKKIRTPLPSSSLPASSFGPPPKS